MRRQGQRPLVVDLDAQASLTLWVGTGAPSDLAGSLRERLADAIRPSAAAGVDLLHGSHETAGVAAEVQSSRSPVTALRRLLREIQGSYDFVFLDAAPGLDLLALNAIVAADELIAPVETQAMALSGLSLLTKTMDDLIEEELILARPPTRVLATKHDGRTGLGRDVLAYLRADGGLPVFGTCILGQQPPRRMLRAQEEHLRLLTRARVGRATTPRSPRSLAPMPLPKGALPVFKWISA